MEEKKIKYAFGLDQNHCFDDTFDTVEELIAFAKDAYENPDGNYWDEDADDYPQVIFVGVAETLTASQFAPSLNDIADQMTDRFYSEHNIDDDADVTVSNRKEADAEWKAFIEKYFDLPHTMVATWIGEYDVKENKWVEKYGKED